MTFKRQSRSSDFPAALLTSRGRNAYTMLEMLIVASILMMVLAIAVNFHRNRQPGIGRLAADLAFHMKVRQGTDLLTESLLNGTEVLKPLPGFSLDYLITANLENVPQVFFLERAGKKEEGPNLLIMGERKLSGVGSAVRKVLCTNVKNVTFTPISAGLVTVIVTFLDPSGKELSSVLQIQLKNVQSGSG